MKTIHIFVIAVTFLVLAFTPWIVYHNAESMCRNAIVDVIIGDY